MYDYTIYNNNYLFKCSSINKSIAFPTHTRLDVHGMHV